MVPRVALLILLGLGMLLPIAIVLVIGTSLLFSALEDPVAARILNGVALALGLAWVLDLIGLTILVAIDALGRKDPAHEERIGDGQEM